MFFFCVCVCLSSQWSFVKIVFDVIFMYSLFVIYSTYANYYDGGYWIDNHSLTYLYDAGNIEYLLLFIFMCYNFYLWKFIQKLEKPYPGISACAVKRLNSIRENPLQEDTNNARCKINAIIFF